MNGRKAVTIGLLTIATLGLVACAINFSKNKTEQTDAYYNFEEYNFTNKTWTIEGKQNQNMLDPEISGININWESEYQIQRNNLTNDTYQLTIYITPTLIYYYSNIENDFIENPITTNNDAWDVRNISKTIELEEVIIGTYSIDGQQNNYDLTYQVTYTFKDTQNNNSSQATRQISVSITTEYEIDREIIEYENAYIYNYESITIQPTLTTLAHTYETGYTSGQQLANPIDIRGLMLNILTMPFTFIRQAFNVTMWEGTAYEFNVSNFILSLIAIATILFILRLFTSGFSVIGNYTTSRENRQLTRSQTKLNKAKTEKIKKETK